LSGLPSERWAGYPFAVQCVHLNEYSKKLRRKKIKKELEMYVKIERKVKAKAVFPFFVDIIIEMHGSPPLRRRLAYLTPNARNADMPPCLCRAAIFCLSVARRRRPPHDTKCRYRRRASHDRCCSPIFCLSVERRRLAADKPPHVLL